MNLMTVFFLQAPVAGPAGGGRHDVDYADSHVRYYVFLYDSSSKQEAKRKSQTSVNRFK